MSKKGRKAYCTHVTTEKKRLKNSWRASADPTVLFMTCHDWVLYGRYSQGRSPLSCLLFYGLPFVTENHWEFMPSLCHFIFVGVASSIVALRKREAFSRHSRGEDGTNVKHGVRAISGTNAFCHWRSLFRSQLKQRRRHTF